MYFADGMGYKLAYLSMPLNLMEKIENTKLFYFGKMIGNEMLLWQLYIYFQKWNE